MTEYLIARLAATMRRHERIVCLTAYDYFTALLAREADADLVLVGDSLGNVVQGQASTVPVSLEQMVYHTRIVCQHFPAERVVLDMPFGTFKLDAAQTIANCARAFKDSGCGGVKFEGASESNLAATAALAEAGVPVLGHLGLLPQRVHADGGYRMQGKDAGQARKLLDDALALERAGAFAVVLECVVPQVAAGITAALAVPTIGIGSGPDCDGQIAVVHDVLGMLPGQAPAFARRYAELYADAARAVKEFAGDIRSGEVKNSETAAADSSRRDIETDGKMASPQESVLSIDKLTGTYGGSG